MKRLVTAFVFFIAVGIPALAGWFESPKSPPASADTISEIERALDEMRLVDAGRLLDMAGMETADDPRLVLLTGKLCLARGAYEDAVTRLKTIATVPSVAAEAEETQGIALSLLGRSDEAVSVLNDAVKKNPAAWRAWNALATEFDKRRDWTGAEAAYEQAIAKSGGAAPVLNNRGYSRLSQNRLDEAAADFVAALAKKPDLTAARNNLRMVIAMKGDYARAVAGAQPSEQAAVLNNIGYVAMLRGDYAAAKDLFTQAMKARREFYGVAAANMALVHGLEDHKAGERGADNAGR